MLPKTSRPSSTAATMVAKLSSSSVMAAASLLTSVPVMPMAMPTSAFFSAGASLTPSPVMATTVAAALPRVDDAQLVGRRDPRVDADAARRRGRNPRRSWPRQLPPRHHAPIAEHADLAGHRFRRSADDRR